MSRLARLASLLSLLALVALSVGTFAGSPARADTSPPGCSANNLSLDITRALAPGETGPANASIVAQGQHVLYTVSVTNHNGTGCDVFNADVSLTLPAADGTANGAVIVLDTDASFPADGSGNTTYAAVDYEVNVNPGVTSIIARADLDSPDGLQDTPEGAPGDAVQIAKTVSSTVANPSIDIEKATNGEDADSPTGPSIPVGDPVLWTYVVTNTGNVVLNNVTVVDDQGVAVSCPADTLAPGESMTCTANGTAEAGQYANLGTTEGTDPDGTTVSDEDPSHYIGQGGGEGCTPGYWKQDHHFWAWTGYDPSDSYSVVFGVNPSFGDKTLLAVLGQGGGGEIALGRHAVAALLNSTNPDVDYLYSSADVIAMVQNAYATGDFNGTKDLLEKQNEAGCDIGKKPKDKDDDCDDDSHKVSWKSKGSDDDCDDQDDKKKDDRDDKKKDDDNGKNGNKKDKDDDKSSWSPFKGRGSWFSFWWRR